MQIISNYLKMNGEELRKKRKAAGLTQEQLAEKVKISKRSIINYESSEAIPAKIAGELLHVLSAKDELSEQGSEYQTTRTEAIQVSQYNEMTGMRVPIVSYYAYGGYLNGYGDPEYLENLPYKMVYDEVEHKGDYLFFEVKGDSMDDGTKRAIVEKDLLLCRNVSKDYWKSRLHLHKWDRWVIVHNTEGILIKEIAKHDVDRGIITIHSYNDFYPDKELYLKDVAKIFNVIEVRRR